ncbi:hypothetical protein LSAT2_032271 [Lamellibrachia satsuma]|nr:hypothetical protein LSAT2_032271 [Lamellibrachia satsuma]
MHIRAGSREQMQLTESNGTEMHLEMGRNRMEMHLEMGRNRTEMHLEMGRNRTEMHLEMGRNRTEMHLEMGRNRTEMHQVENGGNPDGAVDWGDTEVTYSVTFL